MIFCESGTAYVLFVARVCNMSCVCVFLSKTVFLLLVKLRRNQESSVAFFYS